MAEVNVLATLNGFAKEVYGEEPINALPENVGYLLKNIKFGEAEMLGNQFNVPVIVADEQGITYGGADEDDLTLNESVAMVSKNASLKGTQIVARSTIGYKLAAAVAQQGKKAFANSTQAIIKRLMESAARRVEIQLLYGGSGLGVVDGTANVSATETELEFTAASWAPGIWAGQNGAVIEAYDGVTLIAELIVKRISGLRTAKLLVTGTAGNITAVDGFAFGTLSLFFKGAKGKEALGIDQIATTSGSLFGIDNSIYDVFRGQTYSAGSAALTFDKLTDAVVDAINFGLNKDLDVLVSARTWQDLNTNEAALRNYDASYRKEKAEKGNSKLIYTIMNISVSIVAHPCVKEGEAFMLVREDFKRVGAYELSMKNPGMGKDMFRERDNKTSFELRAYTDQALLCERPSHLIKITNIVNS